MIRFQAWDSDQILPLLQQMFFEIFSHSDSIYLHHSETYIIAIEYNWLNVHFTVPFLNRTRCSVMTA